MAHEATEVCAAAPSQLLGQAPFGPTTRQFDLHEFVIRQRLIERCDHRVADASLSHEDNGLDAVGQFAQMPPLGSRQGC